MTNQKENKNVLLTKYEDSLFIIDKNTKKEIVIKDNYRNTEFKNLLAHFWESDIRQHTQSEILNVIKTLNVSYNAKYKTYEPRDLSILPLIKLNTIEELNDRLKLVIDKPLNITLKNLKGWNTINRLNIPLVLKHGVIKCDGHYTDDYARDNADNFGKSEFNDIETGNNIKINILNDIQGNPESYKYVKLYYDNETKDFTLYYGHWLSYTIKPHDSLKLNIVDYAEKNKDTQKDLKKLPDEILKLKDLMQEHKNLYMKVHGFTFEPDKASIKIRSKYYALDIGTSGKFLIDKNTLDVYSIKAYGQKNRLQGTLKDVCNKVNQDIDTFTKLINGEIKGQYSLFY